MGQAMHVSTYGKQLSPCLRCNWCQIEQETRAEMTLPCLCCGGQLLVEGSLLGLLLLSTALGVTI